MNYPLFKRPALALLFPALAPTLGGAVSVRAGLVLGAVILVAVLVTAPYNVVLAGRVPRAVRLVGTAVLAVTVSTLARFVLSVTDPFVSEALGVFLPLVTINVVILRQGVLYEADEAQPRAATQFAQSAWLALLLMGALVGIGAVREVLLTGALGQTAILAIDLSFFGGPGGVLIVVGSLLAVGQALRLASQRRGDASHG